MLRAMTMEQAKLASKFLKSVEDGKITLKDLNEFGEKHDCGVSYILARCKKETRGVWSAGSLTDAVAAVLDGKPDPTGKAKAEAKPKTAKAKGKKKVKAKARAKSKARKAHAKPAAETPSEPVPEVAPTVTA